MYYIGLDIHKKTISYCVKDVAGEVKREGTIASTRAALDEWMNLLPQPWVAAMEATLFTGWIYDYLKPYAAAVKVANPLMLRAIAASKKKNDHIDARKIADCLRCDFLPECYMAPEPIRQRRRMLRYRNLLVRQAVQLKNKAAGLLMETGVTYNKEKLHQARYFSELMVHNQEISEELKPLLKINREMLVRAKKTEAALVRTLARDAQLAERVARLVTIPGVGPVTALSWALEIGEVERFRSVKQAVSYCGLCAGEHNSAGVAHRMPLSKQRNKHLQHVLIEAAKLAPRFNPELALVHAKEIEKGDRNRATLAVARKLVAYLMAVDRDKRNFVAPQAITAAAS
jgi:transposase